MMELIPCLPESYLEEAFIIVQAIKNAVPRIKILTELTTRLVEFPSTTLLPLWQKLFDRLLHRPREELLEELNVLTPIIFKLGRDEAIEELFHAIQDVGRWWP